MAYLYIFAACWVIAFLIAHRRTVLMIRRTYAYMHDNMPSGAASRYYQTMQEQRVKFRLIELWQGVLFGSIAGAVVSGVYALLRP